jgi:hypothetical protein
MSSTADAGPTPYDPQPADRRTAPRRHEEALAHYAREAVLGAACNAADLRSGAIPGTIADGLHALAALDRAVEAYKFAEAQLAVAQRVRSQVGVMPEHQR